MSKAKILLIEDHADLMETVSSVLRTAGFDVLQAADGRDGLAKAQQNGPDLILTDLMLPQLNGYEICTLLKQDTRFRKIPVIIWSATKMQDADAKLALECGADEWALKTIGPQGLLDTIRKLLEKGAAPA